MSQKIFIVPESQHKGEHDMFRLKHPNKGTEVLCGMDSKNQLFEVFCYEEEFSSWFIDDYVNEEGKIHFVTPVDPLFFLLPYADTNKKFCRLEDLLTDENYPSLHKLTKCINSEELLNIFDFKESSGFKVFCYNEAKVLDWLQKKVNYLSSSIKAKNIDISDGSTSSALVSDHSKQNPRLFLEFACLLIAEYLPSDIREKFIKLNGMEVKKQNIKSPTAVEGQAKRQNTSVSPSDDYSTKQQKNSQDKSKAKLTSAQKQLQKVDKKGMKSISSFFTKK